MNERLPKSLNEMDGNNVKKVEGEEEEESQRYDGSQLTCDANKNGRVNKIPTVDGG